MRIGALAIVVASASIASAQSVLSDPFGLKVGILLPTDSNIRGSFGDAGYDLGVSYIFRDDASQEDSIDGDYFRIGGSNYFQSISFGYTGRFFVSPVATTVDPYLGFSAGISFNRVSAASNGNAASGGGSSRTTGNQTQPYGELIAGVRFTKAASVEAFYRLTADLDGFHDNVFGLRLNYKF
jgi:hypothetical protein